MTQYGHVSHCRTLCFPAIITLSRILSHLIPSVRYFSQETNLPLASEMHGVWEPEEIDQ